MIDGGEIEREKEREGEGRGGEGERDRYIERKTERESGGYELSLTSLASCL